MTYNLGPNCLHGMMYAVIKRGDFVRGGGGGLCPSCKVQRGGGGGLCPSCKIHRGDYVLVVKFMGGILSTYTKMSRGGGGVCPGGGDYIRIPVH